MRFRTGLACAAAALSAALVAAPALAQNGVTPTFDPQTTNIPYLAWRGEELRLVKCSPDFELTGQASDWIVEDWSGYPFQPPALEASTVKFFTGTGEHEGETCVKADFVSLKAGLAQIKLVVSDSATGNPIVKHQFLAGWLSLVAPVIREVSETTVPGGGGVLGDPSGDGNFDAGGLPGRVQVQVKGTLPLGNNFVELGLPAEITLPDEADGVTSYWDDLARALATTSDATPFYRDEPWRMWDIHDDRLPTEGHVNPVVCNEPAATPTLIDAVDACLGAVFFFGEGNYSRAFGDLNIFPTYGPFDPLRADETLLPDGKLDGGDVPMPSAQVDVSIAPNTGGSDLGGVGSLAIVFADPDATADIPVGVYKCIAYTRDHKCTSQPDDPNFGGPHPPTIPNVAPPPFGLPEHNHYAPYYSTYLPATTAQFYPAGVETEQPVDTAEASGVDGPVLGNNFRGLRSDYIFAPLYDYWQIAEVLREAPGGDTDCLRRRNDAGPDFRQLPSGPQSIVVYSDEHGEAQVYFNPGTGFFFDNLGIVVNANEGCDLQGIDVLGTAAITAIARYPYQKPTDPDKASNTITKTVHSLFDKSVECVPKGPVPPIENGLAFICTATAIDIDGTPFVDEKVCFMTGGGAEGMREFPLGRPHVSEGLHRLCVFTDDAGEAAVEVFCSNQSNVIVEFVDEGLIRFAAFTCANKFAPPTTTTPGTTTTPPATTSPPITTTPATTTAPGTTTTPSGSTLTQQTTTTPRTITTRRPPAVKDVCPNIAGKQAKVPRGKVKKAGRCLARPKIAVKAKKKVKKASVCIINGRRVSPCVRGRG